MAAGEARRLHRIGKLCAKGREGGVRLVVSVTHASPFCQRTGRPAQWPPLPAAGYASCSGSPCGIVFISTRSTGTPKARQTLRISLALIDQRVQLSGKNKGRRHAFEVIGQKRRDPHILHIIGLRR